MCVYACVRVRACVSACAVCVRVRACVLMVCVCVEVCVCGSARMRAHVPTLAACVRASVYIMCPYLSCSRCPDLNRAQAPANVRVAAVPEAQCKNKLSVSETNQHRGKDFMCLDLLLLLCFSFHVFFMSPSIELLSVSTKQYPSKKNFVSWQ